MHPSAAGSFALSLVLAAIGAAAIGRSPSRRRRAGAGGVAGGDAGVQPSGRTSVWCFFAVVLSALVLAAEWRERRTATAPVRTLQPGVS